MPKYASYPSGAPAALADVLLACRGGSSDKTLAVQDILTALALFSTVTPAAGTDLAVILRAGAPKLVTLTDAVALATGGSIGHNFLINGAFDLAQRGTSYVGTTSAAYGCVDRWYMGQPTSAGVTFSQAAPSPALAGYSNCLKVLLTSTVTNALYFGQIIPTIDVSALQGQTCVLSFWVLKGSTWNPGSLRVRCITGTGTDQGAASVVAGTWTTQANTLDTTASPTTSWVQFSTTVAIPSGATEIAVHFNATPSGAAVDANSYLMITGVDIRPGSTAPTVRDSRPKPFELLLAKYFYRRVNSDPANDVYITVGQAYTTTNAIFPLPESFNMRKVPSLSYSAVGDLVGFFGGSPFASTVATIGGSADLSAIAQTIGSASYTVNGAPLLKLSAGSGKFFALDSELT